MGKLRPADRQGGMPRLRTGRPARREDDLLLGGEESLLGAMLEAAPHGESIPYRGLPVTPRGRARAGHSEVSPGYVPCSYWEKADTLYRSILGK